MPRRDRGTLADVLGCVVTILSSTMILSAPDAEKVSIDEKIGQMLMLGFRGTELDDNDAIVGHLRDRHIGGVVLFSRDVPTGSDVRNIVSPEQLRRLVATLSAAASGPLLIALDQEGGYVRRLDERFGTRDVHAARWYGEQGDSERTARDSRHTARILRSLGITMNLAPVVDLAINPTGPALGRWGRSYGRSPAGVVRHATAVVTAHRSEGVATVLKHFPGHGSALGDSHRGFTDATDAWRREELEPFARMIRAGSCDAIMMGHLFVESLDSEYPATLSEKIITNLLRRELGFDGVVITDDLQMKAIRDRYGLEGAVLLAVRAGVDIMMFANNSIYDEAIGERVAVVLKNLVVRGTIDESRLDASYRRIMALKSALEERIRPTR